MTGGYELSIHQSVILIRHALIIHGDLMPVEVSIDISNENLVLIAVNIDCWRCTFKRAENQSFNHFENNFSLEFA